MGQLPADRITICRPFSKIGVDFAGPFQCKCTKHRTVKYYNIYLSVFICFVTRAVHLEIVSDLSSKAFLDALQRFCARRGLPTDIYSDNGTNFVGVYNLYCSNTKDFDSFSVQQGFHWHFIPPRAPHHGGLWESAVRLAKYHLMRVLNGQVLNMEEYSTVFANIECILNSRPLCYKGNESEHFILTPAHFLIGDSLLNLPIPDVSASKLPMIRRLEVFQAQLQSFWRQWSNEYLNSLKTRPYWNRSRSNLKTGHLVICKIDNEHPAKWPIGVVTSHPREGWRDKGCRSQGW